LKSMILLGTSLLPNCRCTTHRNLAALNVTKTSAYR
jgi:hypothetical protein